MARALITGATGLIGSNCLGKLLSSPHYERVIVATRRITGLQHKKLDERVVDFEQLLSLDLAPVDDVFCALGSTISEAGSWERFHRIDHDYVLFTAELGRRAGAQQFLLVSSLGADPRAKVRYTRLKGEVEAALTSMHFPALHIFRPSFLIGEHKKERPKEKLTLPLLRAFEAVTLHKFRRLHSIPGETVAAAMLGAAEQKTPGVHIYYYDDMLRLARA